MGMTINECIKAIADDRREPDKVLCHLSSLRRAVDDVRHDVQVHGGDSEEVWGALYVDHRSGAAA